jgi:hypothetical protein
MNLSELFLARLHEMRSLSPRSEASVIACPDSTPVLFFGNLDTAEVVTVGINPSWQEFLSPAKLPLPADRRRFLHRSELSGDDRRDAAAALAKMHQYFSPDGNPYWPWFRPLELLLTPLDGSLQGGSAAHTDVLSCFATLPAWRGLKPWERDLVSLGGFETFLQVLAAAPQLRFLVTIGATARRELETKAACDFKSVETPMDYLPKVSTFRPVLSLARWHISGRSLPVVAVGPYRNTPTSPLSHSEIEVLSTRIRDVI